MGAAGFGVSLYLIHIYVTPIKRFLQLLWATGVAGGAFLMATQVCPCSSSALLNSTRIWNRSRAMWRGIVGSGCL